MQQTKISIGPILFLYYEESLLSSNLNSKLFRFHSAHPNVLNLSGEILQKVVPTCLLDEGISKICKMSFRG